jgi:CRP/FNR family transcriptional regulator
MATSPDVRQLVREIFRTLPSAAVDALLAHAHARDLAGGDVLFNEGETAHGIFILLDGEVRVVRSSRGRRHVLHTERRGGTLGEAPLFDRAPYPATAIAATPVRALYVDRAALDRALRASPEVAWFFLGRLAGRVRILLDRVDGLATADVGTRLAAYLLEQADRTAGPIVAATQESLAEELGTVREVVARALRELRVRGVIRSAGRGRVEVIDVAALRAECDKSPRAQ